MHYIIYTPVVKRIQTNRLQYVKKVWINSVPQGFLCNNFNKFYDNGPVISCLNTSGLILAT